jgi:hypothetical protein
MKVRLGFVSNSSSSSFCIFGIQYEKTYDEAEEKVQGTGLQVHSGPYDDGCFVGIDWSNIKDDETGLQFKERIQKAVDTAFGEGHKCSTYTEAWYNG